MRRCVEACTIVLLLLSTSLAVAAAIDDGVVAGANVSTVPFANDSNNEDAFAFLVPVIAAAGVAPRVALSVVWFSNRTGVAELFEVTSDPFVVARNSGSRAKRAFSVAITWRAARAQGRPCQITRNRDGAANRNYYPTVAATGPAPAPRRFMMTWFRIAGAAPHMPTIMVATRDYGTAGRRNRERQRDVISRWSDPLALPTQRQRAVSYEPFVTSTSFSLSASASPASTASKVGAAPRSASVIVAFAGSASPSQPLSAFRIFVDLAGGGDRSGAASACVGTASCVDCGFAPSQGSRGYGAASSETPFAFRVADTILVVWANGGVLWYSSCLAETAVHRRVGNGTVSCAACKAWARPSNLTSAAATTEATTTDVFPTVASVTTTRLDLVWTSTRLGSVFGAVVAATLTVVTRGVGVYDDSALTPVKLAIEWSSLRLVSPPANVPQYGGRVVPLGGTGRAVAVWVRGKAPGAFDHEIVYRVL